MRLLRNLPFTLKLIVMLYGLLLFTPAMPWILAASPTQQILALSTPLIMGSIALAIGYIIYYVFHFFADLIN